MRPVNIPKTLQQEVHLFISGAWFWPVAVFPYLACAQNLAQYLCGFKISIFQAGISSQNQSNQNTKIDIYIYIYIYKCCKYRRLMKVMFIIVYPCLSIFKAPERPRPCTTCPAIISRCLACHRSFSTHWRSIDFPNRCQRSRRSRPCHWQWPRNPAPTSDPWRRTTRRTGSGSHDTRSGRD